MTTVFISHSSRDKAWAEEIRDALRGGGYQSLFLDSHLDDGIHAGAKWEQHLWQQLRQSRGVVVLCTANWLPSPWCVAEAMIAGESRRPTPPSSSAAATRSGGSNASSTGAGRTTRKASSKARKMRASTGRTSLDQ